MNLFVKNRHNKKLAVILEQPKESKGLVFIAHGLGAFKEQSHIGLIAKTFVANNYTTVRFDAAHSIGDSEGKFEDATQTSYYQDLEDVITWSGNQDWYQEPFVLVGHSAGASSVMIYLDNHTDKVKAIAPLAVAYNGQKIVEKFMSPDKLAEARKLGWYESYYISKDPKNPEIILKLNWNNFEKDIIQYDVMPILPKLQIPVLMVVGSEDGLMPPDEQKIIFDKIKSDKELHIIKGSGHTFKEPNDLEKLKNIFDDWIKNKL